MAQDGPGENTDLMLLLPLINKTLLSAMDIRETGYTKTQFIILTALFSCGDLTMSQVSGYISSSKEQATRAVAPLVDAGLIVRRTDSENRTKVHICLTEKGYDFMQQCRLRFCQRLHALVREKIPAEEQAELVQAAHSLVRILSMLN